MLHETLSQPAIFFYLVLGGFASGFLFDFKNIFLSFFKKKKILNQLLMFFCVFFTLFCLYFLNLKFNYGQFRIFSIVGFLLSFAIQRFLILNFVANPLIKCYNKIKEKRNGQKET